MQYSIKTNALINHTLFLTALVLCDLYFENITLDIFINYLNVCLHFMFP